MCLDTLRIGFIGCGRLGQAMAWSLAEHGLRVAAVASRGLRTARELAARVPGCEAVLPQQVVDRCDLVFITTPDHQIRATAESLRWRAAMGVVHCSGATEVEDLAAARAQGAYVGGLHPLQRFHDPQAGARSLPGCPMTMDAAYPLDATLLGLARTLGCPVNYLSPSARAFHLAAAG